MSGEGIINNVKCCAEIQSEYEKKEKVTVLNFVNFLGPQFSIKIKYFKRVFTVCHMFSFLIGKYKEVKGRKKSLIVKGIFNVQRLKSIKTTIFFAL